MASFKKIRTDLTKACEGVWCPFPLVEGISLKIAKMPNEAWSKAVREAALAGDTESAKDPKSKLFSELLSLHILKDWSGRTEEDEEGSPEVKYTPELGAEALQDPELQELRDFVLFKAQGAESYRKFKEIETLKS